MEGCFGFEGLVSSLEVTVFGLGLESDEVGGFEGVWVCICVLDRGGFMD